MKPNYKQLFAKQKSLEKVIKQACPSIDDKSGIYFYIRKDEEKGEKYAYIGLAKNLMRRSVSHLQGYQRIDISLRKRGFYSKDNPSGWELNCLHFPENMIEEKERYYIEQYQKAGYILYNIESGGREGKEIIGERKPTKTYMDGLKQGRKNAVREVKVFFDRYLDFNIKSPSNKIKERKYNEFKEWLESDE
jgi:hypothetical protein